MVKPLYVVLLIGLIGLSWLSGVGAYVVFLWALGERFWFNEARAIAVWSGIGFGATLPIVYFPILLWSPSIRRETLLRVVLCVVASVIPSGLIVIIWRGKSFLQPAAFLFDAVFVVMGAVLGFGYSILKRTFR